ncbi:hypothetical protein B5G11_12500 [Drancourtella sp. An57]|uniref:DUF551 domain-containing protein n=1 Tax=Drancourtella sp. An57 TaxID=1965647 RepID=UPI000B390449|nr:DUF551 domain-containing protein [Drancourtella sp. An57]OUN68580.1 hypothetical protein B5G11_12500 [Drancourtella sp. An57]
MQELEKILEEINEIEDEYTNEDHDIMFKLGAAGIAVYIKDIIRKHMNEKVTTNDLISRQALLDDFRNTITENSDTFDWLNMIARQPTVNKGDGWIPVEERMPEAPEMEDEYPEFNVMIEGAKTPTTLQYTHEGIWVDDYGNAYDVIAWQPLPEPYIPRNQNKPEEHYPEWRAKLLSKFDRRE